MKSHTVIVGVLVAAVVVLGSLLVLTNLPSTQAKAQGGGGGAGSVVALTTEFAPNQNLLYLIDTQAQTILVYSLYANTTSTSTPGLIERQTTFNLIGGRSYKFDNQLVDRAGFIRNTSPSIRDVRDQLQRIGGAQ